MRQAGSVRIESCFYARTAFVLTTRLETRTKEYAKGASATVRIRSARVAPFVGPERW